MLRVFILAQHPLFGQGLASLLQRETEIKVVGMAAETETAIKRIREQKPNAVILDETKPNGDAPSVVMRILSTCSSGRVIGLNLEENTLHLYYNEQWRSERVEDVVEALKTNLAHAPATQTRVRHQTKRVSR